MKEYLINSKSEYLLKICAECVKIQNLSLDESVHAELRGEAQTSFHKKIPIATSLIWAIDLSGISVDMAWACLDLELLDSSTEFVISAAILSFLVAIGTALYIYSETLKEIENNQCLNILKRHISEELMRRIPDNKKTDESKSSFVFTESENKLKDSIYAGSSCAIVLFTSFYWGIPDILEIYGQENSANFIKDRIFMGVAIILMVLTSFYLGYQHFLESNIKNILGGQENKEEQPIISNL